MSCDVVLIGVEQGARETLVQLISDLPTHFTASVIVVEHTAHTCNGLDPLHRALTVHSRLPVWDVVDKDPIIMGRVYLPPPDYHLLVEPGSFSLSTDAPVDGMRPSIDSLLDSAADAYGDRAVVVVLGRPSDATKTALERFVASGANVVCDRAEVANMFESRIGVQSLPVGDMIQFLLRKVLPAEETNCG